MKQQLCGFSSDCSSSHVDAGGVWRAFGSATRWLRSGWRTPPRRGSARWCWQLGIGCEDRYPKGVQRPRFYEFFLKENGQKQGENHLSEDHVAHARKEFLHVSCKEHRRLMPVLAETDVQDGFSEPHESSGMAFPWWTCLSVLQENQLEEGSEARQMVTLPWRERAVKREGELRCSQVILKDTG